jgi:pimeloyl-ACP methyl ester carboxylesterase
VTPVTRPSPRGADGTVAAEARRRRRVELDDVTLDVADVGPRRAPAVLLVSGLGSQRIAWPDELVAALRAAGLRVVTVDNRDAGLSTWLEDAPGTLEDLLARQQGEPFAVPYRLEDMAADLVGVLDHLDIGAAHVLGQSMGGMIAQRLAIGWPDRVATLTSVMSTTGHPSVGQPTDEVVSLLVGPVPAGREAWVAANVERCRRTHSPRWFDPDRVRARFEAAWDRGGVNPAGKVRQLLAIAADGDRTAELRGLSVPTLVVHGREDPVVEVSGGRATAEAVPGARLLELEGMGHDFPLPLLPTIAGAVVAHVRTA